MRLMLPVNFDGLNGQVRTLVADSNVFVNSFMLMRQASVLKVSIRYDHCKYSHLCK